MSSILIVCVNISCVNNIVTYVLYYLYVVLFECVFVFFYIFSNKKYITKLRCLSTWNNKMNPIFFNTKCNQGYARCSSSSKQYVDDSTSVKCLS